MFDLLFTNDSFQKILKEIENILVKIYKNANSNSIFVIFSMIYILLGDSVHKH